jgi:hypothetical protein
VATTGLRVASACSSHVIQPVRLTLYQRLYASLRSWIQWASGEWKGTIWKGRISEGGVWWALQGSNLRHSACKADALPTELSARRVFDGEDSFGAIIRHSGHFKYPVLRKKSTLWVGLLTRGREIPAA